MGKVSFFCTNCAPFCIYSCCTSFSCLRSSCSFRSFSFNSCNSFFVSSILYFSLCLYMFLLSRCFLFASISKSAFCKSGSAQNLQLFSSSMLSTIFLLPLSRNGIFTSIVAASSVFQDVAPCCFGTHSIERPSGSLDLEKIE